MSKELVNLNNIPNLHLLKSDPLELTVSYWNAEEGDTKLGVVVDFEVINFQDGPLDCVIIAEQLEDMTIKKVANGSKRLVGQMRELIERGEIKLGSTPVKIACTGEQKNSTNNFTSQTWSIKRLIIA